MTMEEMARIIGISRITLSKVMNNKDGVSEETRQRVKEYIERYNFEPNSQARSLVGKKEQIIGFFTTYKTLVDITPKEDDFSEVEKYLNSGLIRGAILFGYASGSPNLEYLSRKGVPLVLINQEVTLDLPNISLVNMDDETWGYQAIECLVKLNHRRLLYLTCSRRRLPIKRRAHGVKRALEAYKDQILSFQECNGEFNEDLSYEIVKKIYTQEGEKPTGIFAANDQMAIGAINALKDLGIRVPEEVSVIGFDDISISKYLTPALTTIHCDFKEIADRSVEALIDSIEGKVEKSHQELPLEFVKRESLAFHKE